MANNGRAGSTCSLLLVTEEADRLQLEAACASAGLTALDLPLSSSLEGKQMKQMGSNDRLNISVADPDPHVVCVWYPMPEL
jgi:hypothetical protein